MITLVIADDFSLTRTGIRATLANAVDIHIVGEAEDGDEAMRLVEEFRPNILLLDLQMPGPSSAKIEKWVRDTFPETTTLILTGHDRDAYLADMIDAGAAGYLIKNLAGERLIEAIRRAASGAVLFTDEQIARASHWRHEAGEKWNSLTDREREVLQLIVKGYTDKAIAKQLGITLKAVSYHATNIFGKLEVTSRQEATAWMHRYFPGNP